MRNTAFLTSHTCTQVHTTHTTPPQSPQFISFHLAMYAHTDVCSQRDPDAKCFTGVQPREPDGSKVDCTSCSSIFHSLLMRIFGVSMVIYFKDCLYVHTVYVKYVFIKD